MSTFSSTFLLIIPSVQKLKFILKPKYINYNFLSLKLKVDHFIIIIFDNLCLSIPIIYPRKFVLRHHCWGSSNALCCLNSGAVTTTTK